MSEHRPLRAVVFRHSEPVTIGRLGPALEAAGFTLEDRMQEVREGDGDADLLVVLGGFMGMYERDRYPFLREELRLVERRLADGRPNLGVCLGAQLLAVAAGARVYPDPRGMVIGAEEVRFEPPAREAFGGGAETLRVAAWHGDIFDPIAGATPLARSERHPQEFFALGASLGLLFHPEVTPETFAGWARHNPGSLQRAGRSLAELLARDVPLLETAGVATGRLLGQIAARLAASARASAGGT
ncbi:MAG: glutamine amidotransferase-related protein [Myxococcales bacterium]